MDKSLVEWLQFLGQPIAWGVLSTVITQIIKKTVPGVENGLARVVSALVAVLLGFGAQALIPYASQLDALVQTAIIWIASMAWYELLKWLDFNPNPAD